MLASVVVLPLPVGPVTRMMPLFTLSQSFSIIGGSKSSDIVGILVGIVLKTKDTPSICKKTFARKRKSSFSLYVKSTFFFFIRL